MAYIDRLEGCRHDEGGVFLSATSGGDAKYGDIDADRCREGYGQVSEYRPSRA
jgi:hypothetical protein